MEGIILIPNKNNRVCSEDVLKDNGFKIVSSWSEEGIYEKDGQQYRTGFPIWEQYGGSHFKFLRIKKFNNN